MRVLGTRQPRERDQTISKHFETLFEVRRRTHAGFSMSTRRIFQEQRRSRLQVVGLLLERGNQQPRLRRTTTNRSCLKRDSRSLNRLFRMGTCAHQLDAINPFNTIASRRMLRSPRRHRQRSIDALGQGPVLNSIKYLRRAGDHVKVTSRSFLPWL
jgi:hypothetical protein